MDTEQSSIERMRRHVLHAFLKSLGKDPLVLKGGAALVFMYNAPRNTNDLDFDAERKITKLNLRIKNAIVPEVTILAVDILKDTPTVSRFRVRYSSQFGEESLKIEVSFRDRIDPQDIHNIDGIRVASISRILDQKLRAAYDGEHPRTKARDLYDIDFIVNNYKDSISEDLAKRLSGFAANPDLLRSQYAEAFREEAINADIDEIVLRLYEESQKITKSFEHSEFERETPIVQQQETTLE